MSWALHAANSRCDDSTQQLSMAAAAGRAPKRGVPAVRGGRQRQAAAGSWQAAGRQLVADGGSYGGGRQAQAGLLAW